MLRQHQRGDRQVDHPEHNPRGVVLLEEELCEQLGQEQPEQREPGPRGQAAIDDQHHAERRLGGGDEDFGPLHIVGGDAAQRAASDDVGDGDRSDQQRPLVDLAGDQHVHAEPGGTAPDQIERGQELGRFRGQRRDPLDHEELADPDIAADLLQAVYERLRGEADHHGRVDDHEADDDAAANGG